MKLHTFTVNLATSPQLGLPVHRAVVNEYNGENKLGRQMYK